MRTIVEVLTIAAGVGLGTFLVQFGLALYRVSAERAQIERLRKIKLDQLANSRKEGQQG